MKKSRACFRREPRAFIWPILALFGQAHAGDPVRFWLLGAGYDDNTLVKMRAWGVATPKL